MTRGPRGDTVTSVGNPYPVAILDESGTTRIDGECVFSDPANQPGPAPGSYVPQGGPLTQDLATGGFTITGATITGASGASALMGNGFAAGPVLNGGAAGVVAGRGDDNGGDAQLAGGDSAQTIGAQITAAGARGASAGRALVKTDGQFGSPGQALVSDGASLLVYGGVIVAAGVPAGAPAGSLPFAVDTTAVTGGLYVWNGAAWVKVSTIP